MKRVVFSRKYLRDQNLSQGPSSSRERRWVALSFCTIKTLQYLQKIDWLGFNDWK